MTRFSIRGSANTSHVKVLFAKSLACRPGRAPVCAREGVRVHTIFRGSAKEESGWFTKEVGTFDGKIARAWAGTPLFLIERGQWIERAFRCMGIEFHRMTYRVRNFKETSDDFLEAT